MIDQHYKKSAFQNEEVYAMAKEIVEVGQVLVQAGGAAGVAISLVGASSAAVSAATIIAATGGAAAVVLVGLGMYRWMSKDKKGD